MLYYLQGLAMSTFQVVLVPTILGVTANELFPKVRHDVLGPPPHTCPCHLLHSVLKRTEELTIIVGTAAINISADGWLTHTLLIA